MPSFNYLFMVIGSLLKSANVLAGNPKFLTTIGFLVGSKVDCLNSAFKIFSSYGGYDLVLKSELNAPHVTESPTAIISNFLCPETVRIN